MIQKTTPIRRWKQWLALPLLGVLLVAVACEKTAPPAAPAVAKVASDAQVAPPPPPAVYTYAEPMPELPGGGGTQAIVGAIQQHIAYPRVAAADERTGRVFASFIVDSEGQVQAPAIVKGLGPAYDEAVLAAVRQLPRFAPGRRHGKAVSVSFTVPVLFTTAALPGGENVKIISR